MKAKVFWSIAALCFLLGSLATPMFGQLPTSCSNAMLHGNYGFTINGKIIPPGGTQFVAQQGVSMQHFDGAGNETAAVDFIMTNGVPFGGHPFVDDGNGFRGNESGTYTVNPDCTGSAKLNFYNQSDQLITTIQVQFVLANGGKEIREVVKSITLISPTACNLGEAGCSVGVPATILADGKKLGALDNDD